MDRLCVLNFVITLSYHKGTWTDWPVEVVWFDIISLSDCYCIEVYSQYISGWMCIKFLKKLLSSEELTVVNVITTRIPIAYLPSPLLLVPIAFSRSNHDCFICEEVDNKLHFCLCRECLTLWYFIVPAIVKVRCFCSCKDFTCHEHTFLYGLIVTVSVRYVAKLKLYSIHDYCRELHTPCSANLC